MAKRVLAADVAYALFQAADMLRESEWPEPATKEQVEAAYRVSADMVHKLADKTMQGPFHMNRGRKP